MAKYELSESAKQHKAEYTANYKRKFYQYFSFKCRKDSDKDIIDFLNGVENKSELVKEALRRMMHDRSAE